MATELKGALLFRPSEDWASITADFKEIFDYYGSLESEERREARKSYTPEAL